LLARGIQFYRERPDKEWSLTDCISFVVMAEKGLSEALTGDRHFEQAGFKPLLK
jgi:predicted nucleic acid-binding protein